VQASSLRGQDARPTVAKLAPSSTSSLGNFVKPAMALPKSASELVFREHCLSPSHCGFFGFFSLKLFFSKTISEKEPMFSVETHHTHLQPHHFASGNSVSK